MTGLWGQAMDVEVKYRHDAVRDAYPRRRADRGRRRPAPVPMRRVVAVGVAGIAGAAAGMMTATGRR